MTSNARSGTRILGSLRSEDGTGIVRVEDRYDTDIDDLWAAITDPSRLARWIAAVEGDLRLGATLTADGDQTVLVIEERGLPVEHLAAYGAGWQVHAEDLAAHLAGRERCDMKARWNELIPAYRDQAADVT